MSVPRYRHAHGDRDRQTRPDDLTTLMQRMRERRPDLALTENAVTFGCLTSVAKEERL
ncbi:MAG: hypothetical protein LC793_16315 [Thermomicrobia bacterium]|nr:hypothetical protein [Thermomicrobia bacterium]